jgi:hypothetical protein
MMITAACAVAASRDPGLTHQQAITVLGKASSRSQLQKAYSTCQTQFINSYETYCCDSAAYVNATGPQYHHSVWSCCCTHATMRKHAPSYFGCLSVLLLLLCRSLEKGTTYNAYLIFGETHTALVDASHEKFSNLFIATLKQELAAAGRGIDYILVRSELSLMSCLSPCLALSCVRVKS